MRAIELTQGLVTVVDDDDYDKLAQYRWRAVIKKDGRAYAGRNVPLPNRKQKAVLMHRIILNPPSGMDTDHANGDSLDNRKCNLRIATRAQNNFNQKLRKDNKTGTKGVIFNKERKKYQARLFFNGKQKYLGSFETVEAATVARDAAAKELHGEFHRLN